VEPTQIATITGLILKGLELVHKRRAGTLSKKEAQELYCRIFSSMLCEIYQNLMRCKNIVKMAREGKISAGILCFFVRDALFSDFCLMCPEPRLVSDLSEIYGAFERIHHWQRVTTDLQSENTKYILGYAKDIFDDKKLYVTYNGLLTTLKDLSPDEYTPPEFKYSKTI
jgi:hypothetical protein